MTNREFDAIKWVEDGLYINHVIVYYRTYLFRVMLVNEYERVLGLWSDIMEEIFWVRCENCTLYTHKTVHALVHCDYFTPKSYKNGGWLSIHKHKHTTYLIERDIEEKLFLVDAIGIPIAPKKHSFRQPGGFYPFTLVFEKIPDYWQSFNLVEPVPGGIKSTNIQKNETDSYRVVIKQPQQ